MQKIKLKTEESGKKLLEAYAPPKWSETADDDDDICLVRTVGPTLIIEQLHFYQYKKATSVNPLLTYIFDE